MKLIRIQIITRKKLSIIHILFLIIILNTTIFSQVSDSLFDLSCQTEDLIILSEEMEVNIVGKKVGYMIAYVTNTLNIIIKTSNGLNEFQPFVLPQRFDKKYIFHAPTVRNVDWDYDNVKVQYFNATVRNNNPMPLNVKINKQIIEKRVIDENGFFGRIYQYKYFLGNLEKGDTIQISYRYEIPFRENWMKLLSNRIFFNGEYPKKLYKLNWCYDKDLEVDSLFVNHDTPDFSIEGSQLCYHWEFQNLIGCIDEVESRPYKTLPYFIFVPKSYDIEYTHHDSYKQEFIPIYYFGARKRQMELNTEKRDIIIGNKNRNNIYYQKVANKVISLFPDDTIGLKRMRYFQQYLVDSVYYHPALNYYNQDEHYKKQCAGIDLWTNKIFDNNLERIYGNMVPRMGINLLTAYPIDKRSGVISRFYNSTVKENDLLFAILLNNQTLGFVIPKSDKNNYYFEELPFYYENIPVLLLDISDFGNRNLLGEKRNYSTEFQQWVTPTNKRKDNYRIIQSQVTINLEDNVSEFQTRILLSGQYSTLTRSVYSEKVLDSTINPKYLEPIWNITKDIKVKALNYTLPLNYYPFKTTITTKYIARNIFAFKNNQYIFKPGNWIKMIYSDEIIDMPRFLDYYPDFMGSDNYSYMLEFEKPIRLVSTPQTFDIKNNYCHFSFSIVQVDDSRVLLNCSYIILTNIINKDSISQVKEINQAILDLNQSEMIFETIVK